MSASFSRLRRGWIWLAWFVLFGLLLSGCQAGGAEAALSVSLSELEGSVGVKPPESGEFGTAVADAPLAELAQLRTGADGRARLDFSNGAIIRMSPVSFLELAARTEENSNPRVSLEAGRIFIILDAASQGMDVETPSGLASVRGSFMMVEVNPIAQDVMVACLEGHCEASNPAGKVQFAAGQKSLLLHRDPSTGGYPAPGVQLMEQADYAMWLDEIPEAQPLVQSGLASLAERPAASATPSQRPEPTPSGTPLSTPTPTPGTAAGDGLGPCISLVSPAEGALVDHNNPVAFEWTSRVQAAVYVLELTYADGTVVVFETSETQIARYFDTLFVAMQFSWKVSALDAEGNTMCSSPTGTFTKPEPKPTKQKEAIPPTPSRSPK